MAAPAKRRSENTRRVVVIGAEVITAEQDHAPGGGIVGHRRAVASRRVLCRMVLGPGGPVPRPGVIEQPPGCWSWLRRTARPGGGPPRPGGAPRPPAGGGAPGGGPARAGP